MRKGKLDCCHHRVYPKQAVMKYSTYLLILISCCFAPNLVCGEIDDLYIAAFNVEMFGQSKMSDSDVVDVLTQIVHRYDIILIQEIRDIAGTAILDLLSEVNSVSDSEYLIATSNRLGRSSSKEQYAFLYSPTFTTKKDIPFLPLTKFVLFLLFSAERTPSFILIFVLLFRPKFIFPPYKTSLHSTEGAEAHSVHILYVLRT
uniref:Uncharacterized protein LOC102808425 n=1 Tax=Saccoglossus kowalevskii TaxID=10224 RepID=A0ABM0MHC8_SACKO|nr:PREDICTED: uncharacterized protein LOC102808425 [Saccoglossus kowalevskii]